MTNELEPRQNMTTCLPNSIMIIQIDIQVYKYVVLNY